jgi:hypothetical protein
VFAFYGTASARSVDIDVPAGASIAAGLPTTRSTRLVPVASGYCAVKHPLDERFDALFDPQHPNWPRSATLAWPAAWMLLGWLSFAAAVVSMLVDMLRRRRRS